MEKNLYFLFLDLIFRPIRVLLPKTGGLEFPR